MSILKPIEETVDISIKEIKDLIAYDINVAPSNIDIQVKVQQFNGINFFDNSTTEKAIALIASVTLPSKTQKFEIYESDLKQLLKNCLQQNFEENVITFNYQHNPSNNQYDLLSVSIGKKPEVTHSQDLLMNSLSNMQNLIQDIDILPQNLDEMSRKIESLEDNINKARATMRKNF